MTRECIAGVCCLFAVISAVAGAQQQKSETSAQAPPARVVERNSTTSDQAPSRSVQTRSQSGGRETVVETTEAPNVEGRLAPKSEAVVETTRTPGAAQSRREVFEFGSDGQRRLVETVETVRETSANGDVSTVQNTWAQDVNGRAAVTGRQIERTRSTSPDVRQTETTILAPDISGTLRETERAEYTERRVDGGGTRFDSTRMTRDVNGRWQPVETRRGESLASGAGEQTEEETLQRRDANGNVVVDERVYTRRTTANGQEREVTEVFAPPVDQMARSDSRLVLKERVERTTTATAGGRRTVEEVQGRASVAPNEGLKVIRRTETTVRQTPGGRSVTEVQVFERDTNGTMRLVRTESEDGQ